MTTPFGPQLIGETEKTLHALLIHFLRDTGLTEPQWVTLRLADQLDEDVDAAGLAAAVADRAHFADATEIVDELTARGLLDAGRLSVAGRRLLETTLATSARHTAAIWQDLPADGVAAATEVLNEVVSRARRTLHAMSD